MKFKRSPPTSPERIHILSPAPGRLVRGIHVCRDLQQVVERGRHLTPQPPLNVFNFQLHIRRPRLTPQVQRQHSVLRRGTPGGPHSTANHDTLSSHCLCSFPPVPTAFSSPHSSPASRHPPAKY